MVDQCKGGLRQTPKAQISCIRTVISDDEPTHKMATQRLALWNAEEDIEEDVDLSIAMESYPQNVQYEDCELPYNPIFFTTHSNTAHIQGPPIDDATLLAMQAHMAQQQAYQQIPDVVKSVRVSP